MKSCRLAIIGAGAWGTALALHLARKNIDVCLWDNNEALMKDLALERCNRRYLPNFPFPESLHVEPSFEKAVTNAQDILLVVPSYAFGKVLTALAPYMKLGTRILWATKGIDPEDDQLLHHLVERNFSKAMPFAVLSGPSFAGEVAAGLPTAVAVASNNEAFQQEIVTLFNTSVFCLYPTSDYIGAELGGSIKNVLAIAVGINDGLEYGTNMRSVLITLGLEEMTRLGLAMGAKAETFLGLSGLGDLVLTCTDSQSRNRRFGLALGQGLSVEEAEKSIAQSIEGKNNARQIFELAKKFHVDMPIVEMVFNIISEKESAKKSLLGLLSRVMDVKSS